MRYINSKSNSYCLFKNVCYLNRLFYSFDIFFNVKYSVLSTWQNSVFFLSKYQFQTHLKEEQINFILKKISLLDLPSLAENYSPCSFNFFLNSFFQISIYTRKSKNGVFSERSVMKYRYKQNASFLALEKKYVMSIIMYM